MFDRNVTKLAGVPFGTNPIDHTWRPWIQQPARPMDHGLANNAMQGRLMNGFRYFRTDYSIIHVRRGQAVLWGKDQQ